MSLAPHPHLHLHPPYIVRQQVSTAGTSIALKYDGQGGDIGSIEADCRAKKLLVCKRPPDQVSARISKMQGRGWQLRYFG